MTSNSLYCTQFLWQVLPYFWALKKSVIMWSGACFMLTEMCMTHWRSGSINLIYRRSEL